MFNREACKISEIEAARVGIVETRSSSSKSLRAGAKENRDENLLPSQRPEWTGGSACRTTTQSCRDRRTILTEPYVGSQRSA